jgi:GNAT superfamily N-acetyltransferase/DNA-binding MarR family transcriptional regulator
MARRTDLERIRAFDCHYSAIAARLALRGTEDQRTAVEERLLSELARSPGASSADIVRALAMDKGQLSRTLGKLVADGMIVSGSAGTDKRVRALWLSERGEGEAARLEERAVGRIGMLLAGIDQASHAALAAALGKADTIFSSVVTQAPVVIGSPVPGDLGALVARHGEVGAAEFAYPASYEAAVAARLSGFAKSSNDGHKLWIARVNGIFAGALVLARAKKGSAELELLLVEPEFRGQGIGRALVESALRFAAGAGYARVRAHVPAKHTSARRLFLGIGFTKSSAAKTGWLGQSRSLDILELPLKAPKNQA